MTAPANIAFRAWTNDDFAAVTSPLGAPVNWVTRDNEGSSDVGTCTSRHTSNYQGITVTLDKVYPGYECYVWVGVVNYGSLPIEVDGPVFDNKPGWLEYTPGPSDISDDEDEYCFGTAHRISPQVGQNLYGQQCKMTFRVTTDPNITVPEGLLNATFSSTIPVRQSTENKTWPDLHSFPVPVP